MDGSGPVLYVSLAFFLTCIFTIIETSPQVLFFFVYGFFIPVKSDIIYDKWTELLVKPSGRQLDLTPMPSTLSL